jgi:hypothetical protein
MNSWPESWDRKTPFRMPPQTVPLSFENLRLDSTILKYSARLAISAYYCPCFYDINSVRRADNMTEIVRKPF